MPVGVSVVAQVTTYLFPSRATPICPQAAVIADIGGIVSKVPVGEHQRPAVRGTRFMEYLVGIARSLRPETGELDHPAPFLNLGCHMVAELRGSEDFWRSSDFPHPRLDGRVHQPGIDLAIKPLDDLGWRTPWRADPYPYARLVSWHGIADRRDIR